MSNLDGYLTDEEHGDNWTLMLGDSCERLAELEDNSIDLSVCSPPFDSLFTYSPSMRDLGNNPNRGAFLDHYRYIVEHQLRVTKPGRLACIHVQQIATQKAKDGYLGLTDFRGDVIRLFQDVGWIFHGETTCFKNPQSQSIVKKVHALAFKTKNKDSTRCRPALADYLLIFRKPGENEVPVPNLPVGGEVSNEDWIEWAGPIWYDTTDGRHGGIGGDHHSPAWTTIRETEILKGKNVDGDDEKHMAPLQLEFIRRCVLLYSNPGETVLSPFGGIGSEPYVAVKHGRKAISCELKHSYWQLAVKHMRELDAEMNAPSLLDHM